MKSRKNKSISTCIKCNNNQSSSSSLSTGSNRARNSRNFRESNNLDMDSESSDEDNNGFINIRHSTNSEASTIVFDDILNAIREVVINK